MANMRAWAHYHECPDARSMGALAVAFAGACEAAEKAGCRIEPGADDAGDREIVARGDAEGVAEAALAFAEGGFSPSVYAESEAELALLEELLAGEDRLAAELDARSRRQISP